MAKSKDEKKRNGIIPEPTLRRLPWYLSFVKLLQTEGHKYVSSPRIASGVGVDAALVAKDLSYVELQGRTRVGYETEALITTSRNSSASRSVIRLSSSVSGAWALGSFRTRGYDSSVLR